jgi:malate dehydrogenase
MLSRSSRLAPLRGLASARLMSGKAALVKSMAADLKAVAAAVDALGPDPKYAAVKGLVESEPHKSTMAALKENDMSWAWAMIESKPTKPAVTVAVAGAGSDAAVGALYRIAAGEMLGPEQPVELQVSGASAETLKDLEECGFPLLKGVKSSNAPVGGAAYAILLEGDMKALAGAAAPTTLVAVKGNTNALAASKASKASVTAITCAPQLAAEIALATSAGVSPASVEQVISWADGIADVSHAKVGGKWALKEGGAALPAVAPTASVEADAIVSHMKAWATGSNGKWVSMGVPAAGDYGLGEGLFFSVPVVCEGGSYSRIGGVSMTPEVASALEASRTALASEAASL